ncbi:response regulator transcription factor [Paenibacillus elgii]|uniref:DNA-binding response regulator n=1 Tax=Paenibacillus elgii TaxID=189691 RepID=A0A165QYX2_9BACL|nr:response regulator transcription factor [Paenibacillus elgii]KZE77332.1 PhoB family transcriptional regulator [Paenibacillus elgii]MCM3269112.1 response regulator transcription factor [Paenibacillus elgii]NEN85358.1 response regulator transcription factor [Paenibacillus elgii]PUA39107.1 DNA-binding response regulator [Paenibacillus elgii]
MERKVLLIEDESLIREIVADYFEREQWTVYEAENGKQALDMLESLNADLVILDILMPEMDGWTVCKRIRAKSAIPIIILTAKSEDDDKMLGFELGADDYVTKPFSPKVLVARAKTLMKRVEGTVGKEDHMLSFGRVTVNKRSHRVEMEGQEVELTPKEYELLLYLVKNEGIVLSREAILNQVWGFDYFGDPRVVDTHIKKLRGKLGDEARHIRTVIRAGYKFEEDR